MRSQTLSQSFRLLRKIARPNKYFMIININVRVRERQTLKMLTISGLSIQILSVCTRKSIRNKLRINFYNVVDNHVKITLYMSSLSISKLRIRRFKQCPLLGISREKSRVSPHFAGYIICFTVQYICKISCSNKFISHLVFNLYSILTCQWTNCTL
jgi:hypothetical protein